MATPAKLELFTYSKKEDRVMLTGRHIVRDVSCKLCQTKLGWIYEYATEENQRYKEGRVILERALVTEQVWTSTCYTEYTSVSVIEIVVFT